MAEDESYEMIKADSEIFIGEDDTKKELYFILLYY
jgi:hypothetical protein